MLIDLLIKLYDVVERFFVSGVGALMVGAGMLTRNAELQWQGNELMNNNQEDSSEPGRTGEAAREIGRAIARESARESRERRDATERTREVRAPGRLEVGSASAAGASFATSKARSPMEQHLAMINRNIADIRRETLAGRLLD